MDQVKTDEETERNKAKRSTYLIRKLQNRKLLLIKIMIIIKIIKIILTIKVIVIIGIITITIIIKCRGRYRTSITTNKELLVTLHNGQEPLSNIKKSSLSVVVRALHTPSERLIHHLT